MSFKQHAVGIAMHDARHGRMRVVADRVGELVCSVLKLARVGHELPRDRVVSVGRVDQGGEHCRDCHRIARRDSVERGFVLRRDEAALAQLRGAAEGFRFRHRVSLS